jgi:hypothetical protein
MDYGPPVWYAAKGFQQLDYGPPVLYAVKVSNIWTTHRPFDMM